MPVIGLVLGLIGVITAIVVWRRRKPERDGQGPTDRPSEEEDDRLDQDMARFDL